MKKKILFLLRDYEHGGIPRVLASLLERIDTSKIDADLFVCNPCGIFKGKMQNCLVLPYSFVLRLLSCNYRKEHGLFKLIAMVTKVIRHSVIRFFHRDLVLDWAERLVAKRFAGRYDVLWACSEDIPARLAEYTNDSAKKMLWIHNNYDILYQDIEKGGLPDYAAYSKIVCVAKYAVESLVRVLKEHHSLALQEQTVALYNVMNDAEIREQALLSPEDCNFKTDKFTIVSVGRLAPQKQFEAIPKLAASLKKAFIDFRWYIVGDGSPAMRSFIEGEIRKNNVEKEVILLGVQSNPYAYIASADLMVVTSRYETYPTVINEAKALGTPILSTDFTGVDEILFPENGWYGALEQMPEKLQSAVAHRLTAEDRLKLQIDFTEHNKSVMNEFYKIIGADSE